MDSALPVQMILNDLRLNRQMRIGQSIRDTALFVGTMEEADAWMDGVMWAKDYFRMIGISNEKKIQKQEDLIRQQATLEKLQGR